MFNPTVNLCKPHETADTERVDRRWEAIDIFDREEIESSPRPTCVYVMLCVACTVWTTALTVSRTYVSPPV